MMGFIALHLSKLKEGANRSEEGQFFLKVFFGGPRPASWPPLCFAARRSARPCSPAGFGLALCATAAQRWATHLFFFKFCVFLWSKNKKRSPELGDHRQTKLQKMTTTCSLLFLSFGRVLERLLRLLVQNQRDNVLPY